MQSLTELLSSHLALETDVLCLADKCFLFQENADLKERIIKMNPDTIAADNAAYADADADAVMKDREI